VTWKAETGGCLSYVSEGAGGEGRKKGRKEREGRRKFL
jgi:hypothetical protein